MCLGIPGRIVALDDDAALRSGTVDFDGVRRQVCLAYTPQAGVGEYVIVHVGFAISTVDEAEAARTLAVLRAIPDALAAELGPPQERDNVPATGPDRPAKPAGRTGRVVASGGPDEHDFPEVVPGREGL